MALRGNSSAVNLAIAGSSVAHGLSQTPTEYWVVPTIAAGAGQCYRYAAPDSTNVYFAQGTAAGSGIIFYSYPWSAIQ